MIQELRGKMPFSIRDRTFALSLFVARATMKKWYQKWLVFSWFKMKKILWFFTLFCFCCLIKFTKFRETQVTDYDAAFYFVKTVIKKKYRFFSFVPYYETSEVRVTCIKDKGLDTFSCDIEIEHDQ